MKHNRNMVWLLLSIMGSLACFFTMVFFLHKAYNENKIVLCEYDYHSTSWKVMIPMILGMCFPQILYFFGGIREGLSLSVLIIFLLTFTIIIYTNRKKVKKQEIRKENNV